MKQIEFERWEPDAENPRKLKYAGQRKAEDVFHELEARLDSVGYLPDEYLLLDRRWQNGREMPRDAGFFCRTDYGGSEGIYRDLPTVRLVGYRRLSLPSEYRLCP